MRERSYYLGSVSVFHELISKVCLQAPYLPLRLLSPFSSSPPRVFGTMSSTNYLKYWWVFPKSVLASERTILFFFFPDQFYASCIYLPQFKAPHWALFYLDYPWQIMSSTALILFLNSASYTKTYLPYIPPLRPLPRQLTIWFNATKLIYL